MNLQKLGGGITMKIDLDYMRKVVDVFINAPTATIELSDLEKAGINFESVENQNKFDDEFMFHFSLLVENGLISNVKLEGYDLKALGLQVGYTHDCYSSVPLRLTQSGHDFASMLNQSEVFENLKSNFKEMPFEVMIDAGKSLATAFMKKKVAELTGVN